MGCSRSQTFGHNQWKKLTMPKFNLTISLIMITSGIVLILTFYHYDVALNNDHKQILDVYADIVTTLFGLVIVVLVYHFTILRPDLLAESIDNKKAQIILDVSSFIYQFGFMSFVLFFFSIETIFTIRLFNGFNELSFLCMWIGIVPSTFFLDICYAKLWKYWRPLRSYKAKVIIFSFCAALVLLHVSIYLPCVVLFNKKLWSIHPFIIFFGMNTLLVGATLFSLFSNLSFPFVTSFDFLRFDKEIQKFNDLIAAYSKLCNNKLNCTDHIKVANAIRKKWELFIIDPNLREKDEIRSNTDIPQFFDDIEKLEEVVDSLSENKQSESPCSKVERLVLFLKHLDNKINRFREFLVSCNRQIKSLREKIDQFNQRLDK